jgi:hypothetical protein
VVSKVKTFKTTTVKPTLVYFIVAIMLSLVLACPSRADGKRKLAQETAEYILQRFGRTAVKEGAETLAAKIETYTARHGEEFINAVRRVGPQAFHLVEEAGEHAPQAVRLLSRYGEEGAVWLVSRPSAMNLISRHGEEVAGSLLRHKGIAEPVIEKLGQPAVQALEAVGAQNGRRIGMMLESGELEQIGRTPEVLEVVTKYGNSACDFIWQNKGALAVAAGATAFLADPEPFINGAKDITQIVADVPANMAKEAAGEVARSTNWTLIFGLVVVVLGSLVAFRMRWTKQAGNVPA